MMWVRGFAWCCLTIAVWVAPAFGQGKTPAQAESGLRMSRDIGDKPVQRPLIEVASFAAAPLAALGDAGRFQPKSGDFTYNQQRARADQRDQHEMETRTQLGEAWPDLFTRIADKLNSPVLRNYRAKYDDLMPRLLPGKFVGVSVDSQVGQVDYVLNETEAYSIYLYPESIEIKRRNNDPRLVGKARSDPSKASLFTATDVIGLPEDIPLQLAEIFSDEVDFHRELHQGYRCSIVFEVWYRDGYIEKTGRILAVDLEIGKRRLNAFYFDDGTQSGHFTDNGRNLKKTFRRSPVEFSRVSSDYTLARFHPILGIWRAHRGVDYAVPMGTRVLATADGVVRHIGVQGNYGKLVVLEHPGGFWTYYAHLNDYAKDIAVGRAVQKSQVIGYVGMTGMATGPHLHYEFRVSDKAGRPVSVPPSTAPDSVGDPFRAHTEGKLIEVKAPPLTSDAFREAVQDYRAQLQVARETHYVVLD